MIEICELSARPAILLCKDGETGWAVCEGVKTDRRGVRSAVGAAYFGSDLAAAVKYAVERVVFKRARPGSSLADLVHLIAGVKVEIERKLSVPEGPSPGSRKALGRAWEGGGRARSAKGEARRPAG